MPLYSTAARRLLSLSLPRPLLIPCSKRSLQISLIITCLLILVFTDRFQWSRKWANSQVPVVEQLMRAYSLNKKDEDEKEKEKSTTRFIWVHPIEMFSI